MRSQSAPISVFWLILPILLATPVPGRTQNTSGIFLPPVPGAPFSGVIVVERTIVPAGGGPALNLKTVREVARDSQGRIHNVFRQLVPASDNSEPPIVRIHLYDPQSRSYTYLYPQQKTYRTGTVNHPPAAEPADLIASPAGSSAPLNQFTKEEDLGTQSIHGVSAHGVRQVQTIPAASSNTGQEIVLTDEYWYSEDLHMNVAVKHDDPRTGRVNMTLTQVTRTEPDPSIFQIPDDYKMAGPGVGTGSGIGSGSLNPQRPAGGETAYHIGGPVSAPRLVTAPDPEYPPGQTGGGIVVVTCTVDEKGQPQQVHVVRSLSDDYDREAVQAVEKYRFTPAMLQEGSAPKPVPVEVHIEVNFRSK
jgi:TonB family protein